jgi:cysteine desulfurase
MRSDRVKWALQAQEAPGIGGLMKLPIYLDNHATTPVDPRVLEAMLPYFREHFGNAASASHEFGWRAEEAVETGRRQVASLINASAKEIIFTSGATESNNLALKGAVSRYRAKGSHVITCETEHKSVLDTVKHLKSEGCDITCLPVDREGRVDPGDVRNAIRPDTVLVSIMMANNEVGTLQPIAEIGLVCREKDVLFHTDAVQAVGKVPVDVDALNVDLLSLTAHKLYGPKGVGALFVRQKPRRVVLDPLTDGGGHERGMRSGTLNVPGIVGLGRAFELAREELLEESARILQYREKLRTALFEGLSDVHLNGSLEHRLPGNLNVSIAGVEGESLVVALKDVAVSSGSACSSASLEPSHVLKAMGVPTPLAVRAIRFGIGRFNTGEEIDYVSNLVVSNVRRLRESSPLYEMTRGAAEAARKES